MAWTCGSGTFFWRWPEEYMVDVAIGVPRIRHRTRIDHAQIRRLVLVHFAITALQQRFANELSLILVNFAAQRNKAAGSKI